MINSSFWKTEGSYWLVIDLTPNNNWHRLQMNNSNILYTVIAVNTSKTGTAKSQK